MLVDVRNALRVNGTDLDTEIQGLIDSAKRDLSISGVKNIETKSEENELVVTDTLIKRAIILYCKAHFGYEDVRLSERFEQSYISLKQHLALSQDYIEVV